MNKKGMIRDFAEAVAVFCIVFLLSVTNLLSTMDYILKDALYQRPRGVDSRIKIIAIDEATLDTRTDKHMVKELLCGFDSCIKCE